MSATVVNGAVLITGATGFLGMEVLARYLERTDRDVVVLVRAEDDDAAQDRINLALANLFGERGSSYVGRVRAVAADMTEPGMGLTEQHRTTLAEAVVTIVHCAASISFTLPLAEARTINLEGTRRMIEFANLALVHGGLERFGHVSTAYVAGTHRGMFREDELMVGQGFRNSYEQSKFEAEQLLQDSPHLPLTVLRPSIVMGDSRTGWTSAFNVLYGPLRAFSRGVLPVVPASPNDPVDVVSVDYVADAIFALCESPAALNRTFHLTAGEHATTVEQLVSLTSEYFSLPRAKIVPVDELAALGDHSQSLLNGAGAYLSYFSVDTVFGTSGAKELLDPAGITPAPLPSYIGRLLDFATRARWGKLTIPRAAASTAAA